MPQPDNIMAIFLSANTLALLALAVVLGRYLQRVDQVERDVAGIQSGKTDVAIAKLGEQVAYLHSAVQELEEQVKRFGEYLMTQMQGTKANRGGD